MRSDALRNQVRILEVARDLIGREGPGVSMDRIAAEAGVAVGTLYRHHATKAALVEAVVRYSIQEMGQLIAGAVERVAAGEPAGVELDELFAVLARRHALDDAVKQAAASLGAQVPATSAAAADAFADGSPEQQAWRGVQELLRAAQREGSVRADVTPVDLLVLLTGVPAGPSEEARDRYVDIVLRGIRADPPSGARRRQR